MAHMNRSSIGDIHGLHSIRFYPPPPPHTSFYLHGDAETLCVNGFKSGYRSFCTRSRGLNAYV